MIIDNYFPLFKLVSGVLGFTLITFFFRVLGERGEKKNQVQSGGPDENAWYGMEELQIIDIYDETHDIKTFRLRRADNKEIPEYHAGQFLSFQIGDDAKVFRSYSVSSSVDNKNLIQVSIKKIKDGVGSHWFHSLKPGDIVRAHPPGGLFTDADLGKDKHRVFVGGGIGITPLISMIQTAIDRGESYALTLFYGARGVKDLAFHNTLVDLSKRYNQFNYVPVLSDKEIKGWDGHTGFLTIDIIKKYVSDLPAAFYYFCGPPPMTNAISAALIESGVSDEKLHSEEFVSPTTLSEDDIPHRDVDVQYNGSTFKYSGKKNLLDFLEDEGQNVPFACRSGVCGACKLKKVSGKVQSLTESGLTKDEQKNDYFLSCVSWPEENLELE